MEEIIKDILQIDKDAIEKQERNKQALEEKETQKKLLLKKLKEDISSNMKSEIENAKKLVEDEIEAESEKIKTESSKKLELLEEHYGDIATSISDDAFEIVIRSLEG